MKRKIALITGLLVALTACGGGGGSALADQLPEDGDTPILTIKNEGGFVPVEFLIGNMPRFVVTADRTLYYQGPQIEIFPGPLLPNVLVTQMSESDWNEMLSILDELGIADYEEKTANEGTDGIADAGTDVITFRDVNGEHRLSAYALGFSDGDTSSDRVFATELIQLLDEVANSEASSPYVPDRLQVAAGNIGFDLEPGMATTEPWPLAIPLADMSDYLAGWKCTEVTGDEVANLLAVFENANQATLWGEDEVNLKVTPVLPGEEACHTA